MVNRKQEMAVHVNNVTDRLGLAAAALMGVTFAHASTGSKEAIDDIMAPLDMLFGWSVAEGNMARDHVEWSYGKNDETFRDLAYRLISIAQVYNGSDEHDSQIFMAGYKVFDMCESLYEHCVELAGKRELLPDGSFGEAGAPYDKVYDDTAASHRYWGRI